MTDPRPTEEEESELLAAVRELRTEMRNLGERLDSLYAPRDEVNRTGRRRAWRFLGFAVVVVLVSQALTMTTISYCFLNAGNQASEYCSLMPGYGQAVEQNGVRLARFERLLGGIEDTNSKAKANEDRLEDIEKRLGKLETAK